MSWFGLIKFVTGILVAIALLFVAGGAAARYVMTRLSALPPKPIFPEERLSAEGSGNPPETVEAAPPAQEPPAPAPIEPVPEEEALPEGAFRARIVQPVGMVLRQGPSIETTRIGGIDYDEVVVVLSENSDEGWQNVRLPGSGVEGWIKAGNTERLED
ncbi:MAG: SH3 domain-containing protein [Elainellaceae cyanobacterium]